MRGDATVPLGTEPAGCDLETEPRSVQNGTQVYSISLNPGWLSQLGIDEQGASTMHSLATRPVEIYQPAIIVQPAEMVDND